MSHSHGHRPLQALLSWQHEHPCAWLRQPLIKGSLGRAGLQRLDISRSIKKSEGLLAALSGLSKLTALLMGESEMRSQVHSATIFSQMTFCTYIERPNAERLISHLPTRHAAPPGLGAKGQPPHVLIVSMRSAARADSACMQRFEVLLLLCRHKGGL